MFLCLFASKPECPLSLESLVFLTGNGRLTSVGLLRAGFFPFPSAIKLDSRQPWGINHYACVRGGGGITAKGAWSCNLRSSAPNRQSQNVNPGLQVVNADILCLKCRRAPWKERFQRWWRPLGTMSAREAGLHAVGDPAPRHAGSGQTVPRSLPVNESHKFRYKTHDCSRWQVVSNMKSVISIVKLWKTWRLLTEAPLKWLFSSLKVCV